MIEKPVCGEKLAFRHYSHCNCHADCNGSGHSICMQMYWEGNKRHASPYIDPRCITLTCLRKPFHTRRHTAVYQLKAADEVTKVTVKWFTKEHGR